MRSGHSPQREWRSLEEYFLSLSKGNDFDTDSSVVSIVSFANISNEVRTMSNQEWSRAMRAIWLLNTIEVELSHLGIPLMRVPSTLRELDVVYPGVSIDDVMTNTGWALNTSKAKELQPPTEEELRAVRMLVDPNRIYLGRKSKRETAAQ